MTNADKLRSMTDEELTRFLNGIAVRCIDNTGCTGCPMREGCCYDYEWMEKWMKQEATDAEMQDPAHWILDDNGEAYCSECHCEGEPYMCYCPMCGKKMGGGA